MLYPPRMINRTFGRTGLNVGALGFGAGHIGTPDLSEQDAGTLLNRAVDRGVTLIDTARGYGLSEERVGRHLGWRRQDYVLSSKGGYDVPGTPDWTPDAIRLGIERALRTLNTDHIDIFHLHSCPLDVLRRDDLLGALDAARQAGHIRVAAYSGENDALAWAVSSDRFGSVQTSVNLADQWSVHHALPGAAERGLGVIGKRPVANMAWTYRERPDGQYAEAYWDRLQRLNLPDYGLDRTELALRYAAFAPGVDSVIVGTARTENLERNVRIVERGPLPADVLHDIETRWQAHGQDWGGEI
ncbi:D-threo-aldose 1-dehydrogenase [Deinococcus aquiradiocola]|uniref:D-threo-aldose 1-dehydrogenase n=2 Tax=Deinococcus aquiradiocola TaxID=393059 RepID=A0A917UQ54_9DEIO|nr:D-threo-aldose 1-dehydrogenase [Deinococcus aquiradiocola]